MGEILFSSVSHAFFTNELCMSTICFNISMTEDSKFRGNFRNNESKYFPYFRSLLRPSLINTLAKPIWTAFSSSLSWFKWANSVQSWDSWARNSSTTFWLDSDNSDKHSGFCNTSFSRKEEQILTMHELMKNAFQFEVSTHIILCVEKQDVYFHLENIQCKLLALILQNFGY